MWPIWFISCCVAQSVHKLHLTLASNTTKVQPPPDLVQAKCTKEALGRGEREQCKSHQSTATLKRHLAAAQIQPPPPSSSRRHRHPGQLCYPVQVVTTAQCLVSMLVKRYWAACAQNSKPRRQIVKASPQGRPGDTPGCLTDTTDAPRMP
jgi:hypothetical protein